LFEKEGESLVSRLHPRCTVKRVALVAAHFPPSNLAGVHRARLWAQHLQEFGWKPVIVTTHWRYFEEFPDWELCELLDRDLDILRTRALPTRPRLIGDIGIRGLPWHLYTLRQLLRERRIDFLHITVPSFYSALLGELLYRRWPVPFGIDYIDPWVHVGPDAGRQFGKAWLSMKLANVLEPWAVRNAVLITGVAEAYFTGVLQRNPHLAKQAVTAAMPYGNSARDYEIIAKAPRRPYLFDEKDGAFHMVYAGAMLPKAYAILDRLLGALAYMRTEWPDVLSRLRIHFVGTGKTPTDPTGYNILPRAARLGLDGIISEHPQRVPYADVLRHLTQASAILILGSTEPHYTPSKVYQAVQAKRPLFALLHEASSAVRVMENSRAGVVISLREGALPEPSDLAARLRSFISNTGYNAEEVKWSAFEAFSARESARKLALALDAALDHFRARSC
jgi:hypothetical protein